MNVREIKFKGWDVNNKKWMDKLDYDFTKDVSVYCGVKFCQFTGLTDKNGREIYEGDILVPRDMHDCNIDSWTHKEPTEKDPYSCIGIPMQVKWIEHMCGFDVPPNTQYWEVIGNIHENPELLSGKEALKEGGWM